MQAFNFVGANSCSIDIDDYNTYDQSNISQNCKIYPVELMSKLYDGDPNGNWILEVKYKELATTSIKMNFTIEFSCIPNDSDYYSYCQYSPYFDINSDIISLKYSEQSALSSCQVFLSRSLNSSLKLPATQKALTKNGVTTNYDLIKYNQIEASHDGTDIPNPLNNQVIQQTYASSNPAKASTDLFKLVFTTSLPVAPTVNLSTFRQSELILTDYIIPGYDQEFYSFSWQYPNRIFPLLSTSGFNQFDLRVFVQRTDGSQEPVYILPGQRANILLFFTKNKSLTK
jgi:hypothetical protein